jgi:hypothetical protein
MNARILYIGASGRSGSTLLDRIIGQLPGFVSTGEMRVISRAGLRENRLCGCGAPFLACPFWTHVGDRAFRGWDAVDSDALDRAGSISYGRAMRSMLGRSGPRRAGGETELLRRIYTSIAEATQGATIIDSSKGPRYAALLATIPGLEVKAIHLVRDSRGVAYSWSKTVTRPDVPGEAVEMLRMSAPQVAVRWIAHNAMMELLGRRIRVIRVKYETLLAEPRAEVARILDALSAGVQPKALEYIDGSAVHLHTNHTVMGNPMRMQTGVVPLRMDDAWHAALPGGSKAVVSAITWPFLLRYGYPPW